MRMVWHCHRSRGPLEISPLSLSGPVGTVSYGMVFPLTLTGILNAEPKTNLQRIDAMTFTGSLSPAPTITFTPPTVPEKASETKIIEKVVVEQPPKSRWSRIVSFSTLFNLFLVYVLVSLAQEVQKLRSEVQFIADEQRDLRVCGFERANSRGWVERETTERWEDSAVRSDEQPESQNAPRDEASRDPSDRVHAGQGTPAQSTPDPTRVNWDASQQTQSAGSHSVVSATNPNYGLGRVVVKRTSWMDWINHPT